MADRYCIRHGTSLTGAKTHPYAWAQRSSHRSRKKHLCSTSQTSCCCSPGLAGCWSCEQRQQQLQLVPAAAAEVLTTTTAANGDQIAVTGQHQYQQACVCFPAARAAGAAPLQQQRRSAYLETALQLANNSLEATMFYMNSACLLGDDPMAANAALDIAEVHLAHTLRRTKMAVRMAAAIRYPQQQQLLQEQRQVLAACLQQQQQQLMQLQAYSMQEIDGEEVCSKWHPSTPQVACMQ